MNSVGQRSILLNMLRQKERNYFTEREKYGRLSAPGREAQEQLIALQHHWQEALENYNQFFIDNCPPQEL